MNLHNIKDILEKRGYIVVLREAENPWLQCSAPIIDIKEKVIAFGIMIINNNISLWDASKQVTEGENFDSVKDLMNHTNKNFFFEKS